MKSLQSNPICQFCKHRKAIQQEAALKCSIEGVNTDFEDCCPHFTFDQSSHDTFHLKRLQLKAKKHNQATIRPPMVHTGRALKKFIPLPDEVKVYSLENLIMIYAAIFVFSYATVFPLLFLQDEKIQSKWMLFFISSLFLSLVLFFIYHSFKVKREINDGPAAIVLNRQGIRIKNRLYPWANSSFIIEEIIGRHRTINLQICTLGFHQETISLIGKSLNDQILESLIVYYLREQNSEAIQPSLKKHVFYTQ